MIERKNSERKKKKDGGIIIRIYITLVQLYQHNRYGP